MQLYAYRNTERGIAGMQRMALFNAEQKAKKEARYIVEEAKGEAARILASAEEQAQAIIADAVTKAGRILGFAGMEGGEDKQPVVEIIRVVAVKHGISVQDIKSESRSRHMVEARHEAMALVYKLRPDLSLPAIGRIFNRDHTSVLNAVRKMGVYRG